MNSISKRLSQLKRQIRDHALACDRDPNTIELLAVSKTKPVEAIEEAYAEGQRHFGENYLQEAEQKIIQLRNLDICWHFIGRVQSNKTRSIAKLFAWVHAVNSIKHAKRLNEQRPESFAPLNICIQVNLTGEESKGGVAREDLHSIADAMATLPNIRLRGLMTMPRAEDNESDQRNIFSQLRELLEQLNRHGHAMDTLSMGMSGDMLAAICEGSTMVRIGTAIFGARSKQ